MVATVRSASSLSRLGGLCRVMAERHTRSTGCLLCVFGGMAQVCKGNEIKRINDGSVRVEFFVASVDFIHATSANDLSDFHGGP